MRGLEKKVDEDDVLEIVTEIAAREGVSPMELPPFYEACAVDESRGSPSEDELHVTYAGYEITIRNETSTRIAGDGSDTFELRA